MEFIKKNYEKIILGTVLLGLVGVLACMPVMIIYDQDRVKDVLTQITSSRVEPLSPLDLSRQQTVVGRLQTNVDLDFSTTHRLFNPVLWQKTSDGRVFKAEGMGPSKMVITKVTPLYFSISLDSVMTNAIGGPPRYAFSVLDESAPLVSQRHPRHHYGSAGEAVQDKTIPGKNESFVVLTNAAPDSDALLVKLADSGQTVPVSKDKPFRRADGYTADLRYDGPENVHGTAMRVGDHLAFAGDDYNIIAIDQNGVILLAQSNQKKYNLRYAP